MDRLSLYNKGGKEALARLAVEYNVADDLAIARSLIRKGDAVLDLACGYGRITIQLARDGVDVVGIDLSPTLIRVAKKDAKTKGVRIKFKVGDMCKLPYKDGSFSLVLCFWNSFNHLLTKKDQKLAVQEIYRVLRPRGRAFVVVFDGENKEQRRKIAKEGAGPDKRVITNIFYGHADPVYIHDRASLIAICKSAPFRKVAVKFRKMNNRRRIVALLEK